MLCLNLGQVGCVGCPVTLIPSQTCCVECKYELFYQAYLAFSLSACVFMYKSHSTLKESSKQTGTTASVFEY